MENSKVTSASDSTTKKPMIFMEKLMIFIVVVFVLSVPIAIRFGTEIILYAALFNYFIFGAIVAIKPAVAVEAVRKYDKRYEKVNKNITAKLTKSMRSMGILFCLIGSMVYLLGTMLLQNM